MRKKIILFLVLISHLSLNKLHAQLCPTSTSVSLIVNGDFELGNVGFSSGYGYVASTSGVSQGQYTVGNNPNINNNTYFATMTDHNVSGTGKFMIIDVNGTPGIDVYATTATGIVPNTTYFFSAWFANIERMDNPGANGNLTTCTGNAITCPNGVVIQNSPLMQFFVNGIPVNTSLIRVDSLSNNWKQSSFAWNSGTLSGSAIISIQNLRLSPNSNDLGVDEVFFGTSCSLITNLNGIGKTSAVPSIVSLCAGGGTYNMNPQLSTVYGTIWKNSSGTTLSNAGTYTASTTGTFYLCYDTIPGCYRTDTINVVNTLTVNIGNDQALCNPASTTLLTGVLVPPCTVNWYLNGTSIAGANGANYFANTVGSYYAVVKAPGCATATSNGVNITSSAPTPINTTFCGTSTATLAVTPTNSGKYKWWSSPTSTTAGTLLQKGGSSYSLAVSGTTNFVVYAEDTSVAKLTTGPVTSTPTNTSDWPPNGDEGIAVNVNTGFVLDSFSVYIGDAGNQTLITNIKNIPTGVTTSISNSFTSVGNVYVKMPIGYTFSSGTMYTINFSNPTNVHIGGSTGAFPLNYSPYFSFPQSYDSYAGPHWGSNKLPAVGNWVIRTGTMCARIPVVATSVCALDLLSINLTALRKEGKDVLSWQFMGVDYDKYTIQRSFDGKLFQDIIDFSREQSVVTSYAVPTVGNSIAYYRIKAVNGANRESFSKTVNVSDTDVSLSAFLFPNPSKGGTAKIISNFSINKVEIMDRSGKMISTIDLSGEYEYGISENLSQGVYIVRVVGESTAKMIFWVAMP